MVFNHYELHDEEMEEREEIMREELLCRCCGVDLSRQGHRSDCEDVPSLDDYTFPDYEF